MPVDFCQDCKQPSDLGLKCRACYKLWQRTRYADIPDAQWEAVRVAKAMNACPADVRKAIAELAMGEKVKRTLTGEHAELFADLKRCMAGPFGGSFEEKCKAIRNATEKGAEKTRGRGEVE